jgi:hypothetical protein
LADFRLQETTSFVRIPIFSVGIHSFWGIRHVQNAGRHGGHGCLGEDAAHLLLPVVHLILGISKDDYMGDFMGNHQQ